MANIALITNNILSDSGTALTSVLTGSGTTNYLSKFTGSTALGNSIIYDNGTAVGIGTTSPTQKLQVGDGTVTGNQYVRVVSYSSDIYIGQSGGGLFGLSANAAANIVQDNSSYPLAIGTTFSQPLIFGTINVERMRIASSGNVLIGTTTDNGAKLQVSGNATITGNAAITGITSTGNKRLSLGILDINSGGTPTQIRINTTIPFASGSADFTVNIKGFRYGSAQMVSLSIGWHYYLSSFYNRNAISSGSWTPTITLACDASGYVVIHLSNPDYWPKLYVESVYSSAYMDSYSSGWTWTDADLSNCTSLATVTCKPLATDITGNSGSTSAVSGTTNYISKFTSSTAIGNSLVYDNGTNVGIGTTSPYSKLEIVGPATSWSDSPAITLTDNVYNADSRRWIIGNIATNYGSFNIASSTTPTGNPTTPRFTITKDGYVGIGTTSPGYKLQVSGESIAILNPNSPSSLSGADATLYLGGAAVPAYIKAMPCDWYAQNYRLEIGTQASTTAQKTYITFATEGAERMRIASTGNVLIGTTTDAGYKLDVNGTARVSGNATNGAPFFSLNATSANNTFNWVSTAFASNLASGNNLIHFIGQSGSTKNAAYLGFKYSGSGSNDNILTLGLYGVDNVLNINGLGDVGIGTTSPQLTTSGRGNLTINGSSQSILTLTANNNWKTYLYTNGTDSFLGTMAEMSFAVNGAGTLSMKLALSGNVLIGTTTDAGYKLDVVNGAVRIVYSAFAGIEYHNTAGTWEGYIGTENGAGNLRYNSRQGAHTWYANSAANMTLTAAGNLGIGTTSPAYKLQVAGDIGFTAGANRYIRLANPAASGSANHIVIQGASANTSGTGGNIYLYEGSGAGGPGPGSIYIGATNGWTTAYVTGRLTVSNSGPNTDTAFQVNAGGQNGLTIYWDNVTPYMGYGLVVNRQSRFYNSSSYTFDNNLIVGSNTNSGEKLQVNGSGNFNLGNSGYIKLKSGSGQRHGFVQSAYSNFLFSNNVYYDGSNWRYDQNGYGAQIQTETLSVGVIAFNTFASGTGGNVATIIESMRIVNNGNILMGTTTDSGYKLDVNGTSRFTNSISLTGSNRYIGSGSSSQSIYITGGTSYLDGAYFNLTGNTYGASPGAGSAEFIIRTNSDSKFALFGYNGSSWSRYMTLYGPTGNLNIGSGTTDSGYKLRIEGNTYNDGEIISVGNITTNASAYVNANAQGYNLIVYPNTTSGPNNLYSGGQVQANIYTSSNGNAVTVVPSTSQVVMAWYPSTTQGVFIDYTLWIYGGANAMRSGTFMVVNDSSGNVQYTDIATPDLNASTALATLAAANNGGVMEVTLTNGSGNVVFINTVTRYIPTMV